MQRQFSVPYNLLFSAAVCGVCAVFVSSAAVTLKERQDVNKLLDKKKNVLQAAGLMEAKEKIPAEEVERRFAHPLYGKQVAKTKKYQAHDEENQFQVGDTVRIVETRPLSKTKRWRVAELIERPE